MKKILITLIAAVMAACALFSFAACDEGNFSTQSDAEHGDSSLSTENKGQLTPDDNEELQPHDDSDEQEALTEAEENKTVETSGGIYQFLNTVESIHLAKSYASSYFTIVEADDEIKDLTAYFDDVQFTKGHLDTDPLTQSAQDLWQMVIVDIFDSEGNRIHMVVFKGNAVSLLYNDQYYYAEANSISEEFRELVYSKYCPH